MDESNRVPRSFAYGSIVCALAGFVALERTLLLQPLAYSPQLLLLLVAALISENFALSLPAFNVSLGFPLIISAILVAGPAGGGLVAAVCFTNIHELRSGRPWPPLVFNLGQLILSGCAGGWTYLGVGADVLGFDRGPVPLTAAQLPSTALAALAAASVFYFTNIALTTYAALAYKGVSPLPVARAMLAYLPTQMALALVGVLIAQVLAVSLIAFPLFLFPLLLARQVYQRYENMRGVFLDTVRSLIGALEAKDPYTRGHSERVAGYARLIALEFEMDMRAIERLETAALLHDIGKLTLSPEVLTKPGSLDQYEMQAMRAHPAVGGEMIARIPPLRVLAPSVRMHHERVDGSGYPEGLKSDEIPVSARILAVADAYDAMTTKRAYRPAMSHVEAVRELKNGAGAQFDSLAVWAFINSGSCVAGQLETTPVGSHATNAVMP